MFEYKTNERRIYIYILYMFLYKAASPACTELEIVMLDWLGKMLQLPEDFLAGTGGQGGGVIQVSHHTMAYFLCIFLYLLDLKVRWIHWHIHNAAHMQLTLSYFTVCLFKGNLLPQINVFIHK